MAEISKFWKLQEQIVRLRLEQMKIITTKGEEFIDFLEEMEKKLQSGEYRQEIELRVKSAEERQEFYIEQAKKLRKRTEDDYDDLMTGFS